MFYRWKRFDWPLFFIFLTLAGTGLFTIFGIGGSAQFFFEKQFWFLAVAVGMVFLISHFDYRIIKNYSLVSVSVYLLAISLLFISLGSSAVRGISAWISIG